MYSIWILHFFLFCYSSMNSWVLEFYGNGSLEQNMHLFWNPLLYVLSASKIHCHLNLIVNQNQLLMFMSFWVLCTVKESRTSCLALWGGERHLNIKCYLEEKFPFHFTCSSTVFSLSHLLVYFVQLCLSGYNVSYHETSQGADVPRA